MKDDLKKAHEELKNIRPKLAARNKEVEKLKAEKKEALAAAETERNMAQNWERQVQYLTGKVQSLERRSICLDKDCTDDKKCGRSHEKKEENNEHCTFFLKGYCRKNIECPYKHDEAYRSKKWEEERKGKDTKGKKPKCANPYNQAKNERNQGSGGQGSGVLAKSGQGMQRGTMTTSIDRTGRDTSTRTSSASSAGNGASSMFHTQEGSQIFNQPPLQSGTPSFNQGQVQTSGNYPGQVFNAMTPNVLGSNDIRGYSQGGPALSQPGWGNMSMPINHEYQRVQTAVNSQEMSRLQRQEFIRNELVNCQNLITAAKFQPAGVIDLAKVFEKEADLKRQLQTM